MDAGSPIISGTEALDALLRAAAEAPHAAALFCDIDGTISPIAPTPAEAHVPDPFRELLARLVARLGLVAFVTGRSLEDGRRMIPLDGAAYVGTHGLETMAADGSVSSDPQAERYVDTIRDVREAAQRDLDCDALGVVLEDKRTVLAIHYRLAGDAAATRHQILQRVIEPARERGLAIATGHFLFEIRPPLPFTKGSAVRRLLAAGDYFSALGCGDDLTDVNHVRRRARLGRARRTASHGGGRGGHGRDAAAGDRGRRRARARHTRRARGALAPRGGRRRVNTWPGTWPATGRRRLPRPCGSRQRPVNSGARFCRNACIPSVWSSVANASANRSRSIPCPVARSVSAAALTADLQ